MPKVALVIPPGSAVEAPHDHIVVGVLPGVPDGNVPEHTVVCPDNIIRPGTHILSLVEHAPGPTIMCLWGKEREEVTVICELCRYHHVPSVPLRLQNVLVQVAHYHHIGSLGVLTHGLYDTLNF